MKCLDMFSLEGRTAIVTGASRGIGRAIAQGLFDAGARVLCLARSEMPPADLPQGLLYAACDVKDRAHFETCLNNFLAGSALDVLVNAAGITRPGGDLADFDETIAINLRAPYALSLAAASVMTGGRGSIINVTSLAAWRGFPGNPAYVAAKGGLSQLTRALAFDFGDRGLRVNNLVPGYIETDMTSGSCADTEAYKQRRRHTMLGRWGRPDDLIGASVFLAGDASAYITGQDIVVDGGWLAKGLVP